MIDIELERKSLDGWTVGISKKFRKNFETATEDIRRDWQAELYRQQQTRGDGTWAPLSKEYRDRKSAEYRDGKIPYNSTLRRTGVMLAGYVNGISFDRTNTRVEVSMPFPQNVASDGRVAIRAKSHQGVIGQPRGVPIRSFNIERFKTIATDHVNEAMRKSTR